MAKFYKSKRGQAMYNYLKEQEKLEQTTDVFKPYKQTWVGQTEELAIQQQKYWYRMPDGYAEPNLPLSTQGPLIYAAWQDVWRDTTLSHDPTAWAKQIPQDTAYDDAYVREWVQAEDRGMVTGLSYASERQFLQAAVQSGQKLVSELDLGVNGEGDEEREREMALQLDEIFGAEELGA